MINLDLETCPIGEQVKTRKGTIWTHVGLHSWKDESSGLTWFPENPGRYNHKETMDLENDKQRLPTKEEFEEAEKHGIREVLNMFNKWYWSASVHPSYSYYAYDFSGGDGDIGYDSRDDSYVSVRCVGR